MGHRRPSHRCVKCFLTSLFPIFAVFVSCVENAILSLRLSPRPRSPFALTRLQMQAGARKAKKGQELAKDTKSPGAERYSIIIDGAAAEQKDYRGLTLVG